MIFVDRLMNWGMTIRGRTVPSCHLWSNKSTVELIEFGKKIGMKQEWIHTGTTGLEHFDLVPSKRTLAVKNGAKEVNTLDEMLKARSGQDKV